VRRPMSTTADTALPCLVVSEDPGKHSVDADNTTHVDLEGLSSLPASSHSRAVVHGSTLPVDVLSTILRCLTPAAPLSWQVSVPANDDNRPSPEDVTSMLTLSGFVDVSVTVQGDILAANATKPKWETGASFKIKRKTKAKPAEPAKGIWTLDSTMDDDMMDPEELLTEDDLIKPDVAVRKGCAPTRKACKDCTCGRKEMEEGVVVSDTTADVGVPAQPMKSSCGSCSLGDAFRCEGCPFLGMPAFEKGQEDLVLLQKGQLAADL